MSNSVSSNSLVENWATYSVAMHASNIGAHVVVSRWMYTAELVATHLSSLSANRW